MCWLTGFLLMPHFWHLLPPQNPLGGLKGLAGDLSPKSSATLGHRPHLFPPKSLSEEQWWVKPCSQCKTQTAPIPPKALISSQPSFSPTLYNTSSQNSQIPLWEGGCLITEMGSSAACRRVHIPVHTPALSRNRG